MVKIVKRSTVDFEATFANMKPGDTLSLSLTDITENRVRVAVFRYNRKHNKQLKVTAPTSKEVTVVCNQ